MTPLPAKTKVSSQGRTVIPVEIREKLGIHEGEEVEWDLRDGTITVRLVREERTPDEIMEYLREHLLEIRHPPKGIQEDTKRRMAGRVRRKLGQTL